MWLLKPGTAESFSSVVMTYSCSTPHIIGTTTPLAMASGARTRAVLSPTPPVEYLSIFGFAMCDRSMTSPESIISSVRIAVSCADMLAK